MAREFFKNLPNTTTPVTAPRLNELLDGDEAMGNIVVDSIRGKNLFNVNNITTLVNGSGATSSINYTNKTITLTGYYHQTNQTLKELCPHMVAGKTYVLSFVKSPSTTNNFIYLGGGGGTWNNGTSKTITQNDLNGKVNFYGGAEGTTTEYVMSNIMIEEGSSATTYAPYQENFDFTVGSFEPTIQGRTTAGTATYTVRNGHYIKMGKLVFYQFQIGCTLSGSAGIIYIRGIPYLENAYDPSLGNVTISPSFDNSKPLMQLRKYYDGFLIDYGNLGNIGDQNWSSTKYIYGSGYFILQ